MTEKKKRDGSDSLDELVCQFESERQVEGDRFQKNQGGFTVSAFNPRSTQQRAERRHRDLMGHIRNWSLRWWEKRGYKIEFEEKISTAGKLVVSDNVNRPVESKGKDNG